MKPFLRWAGGKQHFIDRIIRFTPTSFDTYWEPFLGAGAMFFALAPKTAHLSDLISDLISCFSHIRSNPLLVHKYLTEHTARDSENYYYSVRERYNCSKDSVAQAARFIYLNKSSFNGIFRVNLEGKYNVPYGHKKRLSIPSRDDLLRASEHLQNSRLAVKSYDEAIDLEKVGSRDFIYLDPPYLPLTTTSNFRHYTSSRFSEEDHNKLAIFASKLSERQCKVMISNSDTPMIRSLYTGWNIFTLPVTRWLSANGRRFQVQELVITNYMVGAEVENDHN